MSFKSKEVNSHTTLAYRKPPISGNIINGLGEKEWRRASHVFHRPRASSVVSSMEPWVRRAIVFARTNSTPASST